MAGKSSIEWTGTTWDPVRGCTIKSAGCTNCYAMKMAMRLEAMGQAKYAGMTRRSGGRPVWSGKVVTDEAVLLEPLRWRVPRMVFVNSMADLFHPDVDDAFITKLWMTMAGTGLSGGHDGVQIGVGQAPCRHRASGRLRD